MCGPTRLVSAGQTDIYSSTFMHLLTPCTQHIVGHHPYANIDGFDPDLQTKDNVSTVH